MAAKASKNLLFNNLKRLNKFAQELRDSKCPTCDEFTMLVGLTVTVYRCMNCGSDLEQHVNGKISYLPHITRSDSGEPFVREWKDGEKV
jgi:uncharacterized protein (DUF983 family)